MDRNAYANRLAAIREMIQSGIATIEKYPTLDPRALFLDAIEDLKSEIQDVEHDFNL
jgi:cytosine/adenosine deaminase-related metal-dependent hydrolase